MRETQKQKEQRKWEQTRREEEAREQRRGKELSEISLEKSLNARLDLARETRKRVSVEMNLELFANRDSKAFTEQQQALRLFLQTKMRTLPDEIIPDLQRIALQPYAPQGLKALAAATLFGYGKGTVNIQMLQMVLQAAHIACHYRDSRLPVEDFLAGDLLLCEFVLTGRIPFENTDLVALMTAERMAVLFCQQAAVFVALLEHETAQEFFCKVLLLKINGQTATIRHAAQLAIEQIRQQHTELDLGKLVLCDSFPLWNQFKLGPNYLQNLVWAMSQQQRAEFLQHAIDLMKAKDVQSADFKYRIFRFIQFSLEDGQSFDAGLSDQFATLLFNSYRGVKLDHPYAWEIMQGIIPRLTITESKADELAAVCVTELKEFTRPNLMDEVYEANLKLLSYVAPRMSEGAAHKVFADLQRFPCEPEIRCRLYTILCGKLSQEQLDVAVHDLINIFHVCDNGGFHLFPAVLRALLAIADQINQSESLEQASIFLLGYLEQSNWRDRFPMRNVAFLALVPLCPLQHFTFEAKERLVNFIIFCYTDANVAINNVVKAVWPVLNGYQKCAFLNALFSRKLDVKIKKLFTELWKQDGAVKSLYQQHGWQWISVREDIRDNGLWLLENFAMDGDQIAENFLRMSQAYYLTSPSDLRPLKQFLQIAWDGMSPEQQGAEFGKVVTDLFSVAVGNSFMPILICDARATILAWIYNEVGFNQNHYLFGVLAVMGEDFFPKLISALQRAEAKPQQLHAILYLIANLAPFVTEEQIDAQSYNVIAKFFNKAGLFFHEDALAAIVALYPKLNAQIRHEHRSLLENTNYVSPVISRMSVVDSGHGLFERRDSQQNTEAAAVNGGPAVVTEHRSDIFGL